MKWSEHVLSEKVIKAGIKLNLNISQVQLLLAQERFLARLASTKEGQQFVWKGGSLLLRLYSKHMVQPRFTVDIDLLAKLFPMSSIENYFSKLAQIDLSDGFEFFNIRKTPMQRETPYGGDRYSMDWRFFKKPHSHVLRVDVCAGDDVSEIGVAVRDIFLIGEDTSLSLNVYPPEFIFAEKLETVDRFETGNTRLKDFIDMWMLIEAKLDADKTKEAILRCFKKRKTTLNPERWNKIFKDKDFIEILEQHRLRRYSNLKLPSVSEMIHRISNFLSQLNWTS